MNPLLSGLTNQQQQRIISMNNIDKYAIIDDTIKESVSALEVGNALGLEIRRNRCKCPIHNGDGYNCVLNKDARGYYCHVCKSHGDAIALAQNVSGLGFLDTLRWFNATFGLGLNIDEPTDEKRLKQAKNGLKRKREDAEFKKRVEKLDYDMYLSISARLSSLEQQRDDNRPRRYSEDWNDKFCEAVNIIPVIKRYMEYFAIQCTVVRK